MRGQNLIHFTSSCHRIALSIAVLVVFAYSIFAQDLRSKQECERLFASAALSEQQNDLAEAEFNYEQCRELAKKNLLPKVEAASIHRLAVIKARNKKFSDSADLFRTAIALDPKNSLILCDFARLYADRKMYEDAETILKNALNLDPSNPQVLFGLGSIIASQSQRTERQAEGLRYLKLAVGEVKAYQELAKIYRAKGDVGQAEFAEQKAKLADTQLAASGNPRTSAGISNGATAVQPPRKQTPPEVVNRVRQELVQLETREIADAQQRVMPAVGQTPFIPAPNHQPASDNQQPIAAFPIPAFPTPLIPNTATLPEFADAKIPPPAPVTPFPVAPVTVISSDPFAQAVVIPTAGSSSPSPNPPAESILVIQPSEKNKSLDTLALVRVSAKKTDTNKNASEPSKPEQNKAQPPPLVKPAPSQTPNAAPKKGLSLSEELDRQLNVPPIRILPNGGQKIDGTTSTNSLRRIPSDNAPVFESKLVRLEPVKPKENVPLMIAAIPAYSATKTGEAEVKRIPERQENPIRSSMFNSKNMEAADAPQSAPKVYAAKPKPNGRPLAGSIAVKTNPDAEKKGEADVLKSPSAIIAERKIPESKFASEKAETPENVYFAANLYTERPMPVPPKTESAIPMAESEPVKVARSEHQFISETAPNVLAFGIAKNEPPVEKPMEKSVEIASTLPEKWGSPVAVEFGAIPQPAKEQPVIAKIESKPTLDYPQSAIAKVVPVKPVPETVRPEAALIPFPEVAVQTLPSVDPFASVNVPPASDEPAIAKFAEPRIPEPMKPEPQIAQTKPQEALPPKPVNPFLIANTPQTDIRFAEPVKPEPQIAQTKPQEALPPKPVNPFLIANTPQTDIRFAEPAKSEPQITQTKPQEASPVVQSPSASEKIIAKQEKRLLPPPPTELPRITAEEPVRPEPQIVQAKPREALPVVQLPSVSEKVIAKQEKPLPPPMELPRIAAAEPVRPEPKYAPLPVAAPEVADMRMMPVIQHIPEQMLPVPPQNEESAGFATTRRANRSVVADNDQPAGFARSRKR